MSYACPRCQTFWGTIKSAHDSAVLLCRKCQNRWEVFSIGAQINAFPDKEKRDELANLRTRLDNVTKQRNDVLADFSACKKLLEEQKSLTNQLQKRINDELLPAQADAKKYNVWCLEWRDKHFKLQAEFAERDKQLDRKRHLVHELQAEADVLREENKRLGQLLDESTKSGIASDSAWSERYESRGSEIKRLQAQVEELESFRKLSGEFATLAKRDAIREANKRLQQENQQHTQQIKSLQADLNEAIKKNLSFAYIEAERNGWKVSAEEHKAVANSLQQRLNDATKNLEAHEAAWCINWQEKVRKLKGQITILEAARDHWQTESDNWRMKHNELFDDNKALKNIRDNWEKTAQQESNNAAWYRGILDAIGAFFGDAAKTDDTGKVTDSVFYSKLQRLVEEVVSARNVWKNTCRVNDDAWQKNYSEECEKNKELRNEIHNLKRVNEELESFRKLSGEYATLACRDKIREENKRLKTENENHLKQIRGLQDTLRENSFRWDVDLAILRKENGALSEKLENQKGYYDILKQRFDALKTRLQNVISDE